MRLKSLLIPTLVAILVAAVAVIFRHRTAPHAVSAAVHNGHLTIAISNYAFLPNAVTVTSGTRVTWTNHDNTAHTATADNGSFDTGTVAPHASRVIDFQHPGTYTYHCAFHAFMTATITVKP
ncbi:MAG: cupredoxin domain-containing protein [Solirubrobacterales bacterium]|nr:cupredoxin domain-containing protein [Solirubrobacterales bacterium]